MKQHYRLLLSFIIIPLYSSFTLEFEESLTKKIGQMLLVGFKESDLALNQIKQNITEGNIGGVILYARNIKSDLQSMISDLKSCSKEIPLLVSVDQEGGKVARIKDNIYPSAYEISKKSLDEAKIIYTQMAQDLKKYGINLNFGPVVDLDYDSPIIGKLGRSYGKDPETVVSYANCFIDGMESQGILTSLKHFPGHGSSKEDTHLEFTDVTNVWKEEELEPYKMMINNRSLAQSIMIAHITNFNLDNEGWPASMSYKIVTDLLRNKLGYEGMIITDDLNMKAISTNYSMKDVCIKSINAGCDMLMFSGNIPGKFNYEDNKKDFDYPTETITIIKEAIESGDISKERIDESYQRILKFKKSLS